MTERIAGLDLSLRDTGVALVQPGPVCSVYRVTPVKQTGHQRLKTLYTEIRHLVYGTDLIVVEGPAFAQGSIQHTMGGAWWIILHVLWLDNPDVQVVVVAPTVLKRFATGKGNADKDEVLAATINRYHGLVPLTNNNEADAFNLAAMGAHMSGFPLAEMPKTHTKALEGWPYVNSAKRSKKTAGKDS
jgi:crossover junction endodeoxyribonuclease RuvC